MSIYTIPFNGIIGAKEYENDNEVYFSLNDLAMHLHNAVAFETIALAINSKGGYCDTANKMINLLNETGKKIITYNTGVVASAASKIFTLPKLEDRTYYPERGEFLIHNPWVSNVEGDSSLISDVAKQLKATENQYVKWYAEKTGVNESIISSLMSENTPLTTEQIEKFNFAIINKPTELKAVAYLKQSNNMTEEDVKKLIDKKSESLLSRIKAVFKFKSLMLVDVDGNELEYPDITTEDEITEGTKVTLKGQPATGEFKQANGNIIKAENGIVTEIVKAGEDVAALKKQIEDLQAKVAEQQAAINAKETELSEQRAIAMEATAFIKEVSDYKFKAVQKPTVDDKKPKKQGVMTKEEIEKL